MSNEDSRDDTLAKAVEHAREFAVARLEAGDRPDELSFALAFIAAEMGLHTTRGKEPLGVFRTVLHALAAAAASGAEGNVLRQAGTHEVPAGFDDVASPGAVLH